jgi:hypothetical protein
VGDDLIFTLMPMFENRVQKYGESVFLIPAFCFAGITASDADGHFVVECHPSLKGRVHLNFTIQDGDLTTGWDSQWVDVTGRPDIVLRDGPGARFRLPDGKPVGDLQAQLPIDTESLESLEAAPPDALEEGRKWIIALRDEATAESRGHPPKGRSTRTDLIPHFVSSLSDRDSDVRDQAICALAYMNAPETLEVLVGAIRHSDWSVRWYALMGLEWLGAYEEIRPQVVAALRRVVTEGDRSLKFWLAAAEALVQLGELEDPAFFFEALRRKDGDVGVAAAALTKLGRRDAVELIVHRMEDSENRYHVGECLKALTGQTHGDSVARWKEWFEAKRSTLPPQAPVQESLPSDRAYVERCHARWRRKDAQGALADIQSAVTLRPDYAPGLVLRAWIRLHTDDLDGALADAEAAVLLDPYHEATASIRAHVREARGDVAGAVADLKSALKAVAADGSRAAEYRRRLEALDRCARCGASGTVGRVTEIESGKARVLLLCATCLQKAGATGPL